MEPKALLDAAGTVRVVSLYIEQALETHAQLTAQNEQLRARCAAALTRVEKLERENAELRMLLKKDTF